MTSIKKTALLFFSAKQFLIKLRNLPSGLRQLEELTPHAFYNPSSGLRRLKEPTPHDKYYIIPMPPPPIGGIAGVSSLISATTDSVVNSVEATEVAFCNAERVTFTGSMIPASIIFT